MKKLFFLALVVCAAFNSLATVKLPSVIGNNMVLQQKSNANLWGSAKPSAKVSISTSWDNKKYTVNADANGAWKVAVATPAAGGPFQITFDDGSKTTLDNIMIGEVWVCSGQSNMVMPVKGYTNQPVEGVHDILLNSKDNDIRLFTVKVAAATEAQTNLTGEWKLSNPQNILDVSAAAYVFGKNLSDYLGVPVGLIVTAVGGTPIRSWMDDQSVKMIPEITRKLSTPVSNRDPSVLFNAMVAPLTNFTIRGFTWYQGESDRGNPELYEREMAVLINNWRTLWKQGELPFYFVQIAPWLYPGNQISTAFLREAQLKASHNIPNTGMAVTMDVGSDKSIHPPKKVEVGNRLAYIALAKTYNVQGLPYLGPEYKSMQVKGNKATLTFENTGMGMYFSGKASQNFQIAGADKQFFPAKASITGKGIVVESDRVAVPVAVRYAFEDYVIGDLFNNVGLPASSFRTDDWPIK